MFVSPVAEVEVAEVAVLLNSVVQPLVQDLDEGTHIRKVLVHLGAVGEVAGRKGQKVDSQNALVDWQLIGMFISPYHSCHEV